MNCPRVSFRSISGSFSWSSKYLQKQASVLGYYILVVSKRCSGTIVNTSYSEWDRDVLSLESIVLELEYLTNHAPETRAECIAFLCQEAWDAIAAAPLASAGAGPQLCAHWEGHVGYFHLHPEPFKPFQHVWVCNLTFSALICHKFYGIGIKQYLQQVNSNGAPICRNWCTTGQNWKSWRIHKFLTYW